jgi:ABC-type antimicrobial peptide transport system permease subunit
MNQLFRTGMEINYGENISLLILFILLTLLVGITSGSYISFFLAKFDPVHVFKEKSTSGRSKTFFQKVLITLQIFFFVCLFSGSQVIFRQINLGKKADLGFNYTNLAHMQIGRRAIVDKYNVFKQELLRNPDIILVSGGNVIPPNNSRMITPVPLKEDPDQKVNLEGMGVDFDFFEILEINILDGRNFSQDFPTDSNNYIINEMAAKMLGLTNPIGEKLMEGEIIGVVRNIQVHSIHEGITPLAIQLSPPKYISEYLVKYREGRFSEVSEYVKSVMSKMAPDSYLDLQPFEERLGEMYYKEKRLGSITLLFGGIAIVIAILGLFGHSLFAARQQTREIGIRKAHGALTKDILRFYGKDFIITTFVANILACPVTIIIMNKWLQNFEHQAGMGIVLFTFSLVVSLFIVVITILSHSLSAANVNPANTLRYE